MPSREDVSIDLADLTLTGAEGRPVRPGEWAGVRLVVLLRHRH